MVKLSTKMIEEAALNKIKDLLLRIKDTDSNFKSDDKEMSWDGFIYLFNGKIEDKSNYESSIRVQIKGRSTNVKRLQDKRGFDLSKSDLENYLKEDGTLFFLVLFKDIDNYKIYYADLLPYNLRNYLKSQTNNKDEIKIKVKEVKDYLHLERIIRNFAIDKREQKKISNKVFDSNNLFLKDGTKVVFYDWNYTNPDMLLGENKYFYEKDKYDNIIGISYGKLFSYSYTSVVNIKNKDGILYYNDLEHINTINGKQTRFGKAFTFNDSDNLFNIHICGTLNERIKQMNFVNDLAKNHGFLVNDKFLPLEVNESDVEKCLYHYDNFVKIRNFLDKHKINKDIDLDKWKYNDFANLLIWIDAFEDKILVKKKEWKSSVIGAIKINEIVLSVIADIQKDGSFIIYSIWNDKYYKSKLFKYNDDIEQIETTNLYLVLNYKAYLADDIDINAMKKYFNNHRLEKNEEILVNLTSLEVIKAYDISLKEELLEYAMFLLKLVENYDEIKDIVYINKMQIKKRLNNLNLMDKKELINIKNHQTDIFYQISINILIDSIDEAKILYDKLEKSQKEIYDKFPIAKFLNNH